MAKVHESYDAGQFLTGNLNHFTVTKTGMAASDMKAIVETTGTRATVVLLGAIDGNDVRIAVENFIVGLFYYNINIIMKLLIFGDSFPRIINAANWKTTSFGYHLFKKSKIFTGADFKYIQIWLISHTNFYSNCNSVINKQDENTIDYIFPTDPHIYCVY